MKALTVCPGDRESSPTRPEDFVDPREWERRVDLRCTGMTVHTARQSLATMVLLWEEAERRGWKRRAIILYAERQVRLRQILAG